jgi:UDP-glucuronate decarboxylase
MKPQTHFFVTGGTGFFGRALIRHWLERYTKGLTMPNVTVLTRSSESFLLSYGEFKDLPWLDFHIGDITDASSLPKKRPFTHILHAATDSTLGPSLDPLKWFDQIVTGTRNILDVAVASGARRFLLTSSGAVYGPQPAQFERIPEDYNFLPNPLTPANAYGVGKRMAEHLCTLYSDAFGLETVIARCFAFVGRDLPLDVHFAIGNFIRDAIWNKEIVVGGDGTPIRSYLDQSDLATWLLAIIESGRAGDAYNVGSDHAITIADLAHLVRDLVCPSKSIRILDNTTVRADRNRYLPDITKAQSDLDLLVSVPLSAAIKTATLFHQETIVSNRLSKVIF